MRRWNTIPEERLLGLSVESWIGDWRLRVRYLPLAWRRIRG